MNQQQQQEVIRRTNNSATADDNHNSDTEAAASALTALGASISQQHKLEADGDHDDEEDGVVDIEFPQRFTKSGRKRAVSFPLKVRHKQTNKKTE